jgi:hypothetical protein
MADPSPHPCVITLGIDRPANLLMVARSLGLPINRPAWDTDTLRARLRFLLTWAESQPATGVPDSGGTHLDGDRWVHRYPTIPRSHPLHGYIEALGLKIQEALTLVDQGALKDATEIHDEAVSVIEQLSTRLAEPDAARGAKMMQGFSSAGQQRSDLYAPARQHAQAEAKRLWRDRPFRSIRNVAKLIHDSLKPDERGYLPPENTIRKWIAADKPRRQSSA